MDTILRIPFGDAMASSSRSIAPQLPLAAGAVDGHQEFHALAGDNYRRRQTRPRCPLRHCLVGHGASIEETGHRVWRVGHPQAQLFDGLLKRLPLGRPKFVLVENTLLLFADVSPTQLAEAEIAYIELNSQGLRHKFDEAGYALRWAKLCPSLWERRNLLS